MTKINCDWCYRETRTYITAKYVICTGRIDTMKVHEFFICMPHADILCANPDRPIAGLIFDDWELRLITSKVTEFHDRREAEQLRDALRDASRTGYLPYSIKEPDTWRLHRAGIHWNP